MTLSAASPPPLWLPNLMPGGQVPVPLGRLKTDVIIRTVGVSDYATWGRPHEASNVNYGYPALDKNVFRQMSPPELLRYAQTHTVPVLISYNGGVTSRGNDPSDEILRLFSLLMAETATPGLTIPGLPTSILGPNGLFDLGDVFVIGGSVGGRNVLRIASTLTTRQVPLRLVTLWDAAFYLYEDNYSGAHPDYTFAAPMIKARETANYYQSIGNAFPNISSGRYTVPLRFETLARSEKHGKVQGIQPVNLDSDPAVASMLGVQRKPNDSDADWARTRALIGERLHDWAYMEGEARTWASMLRIMAGR